eukprot:CAMPEP_0172300728 /NCGR_PEP_ID=MMETSP1058-20130122/2762_1 /TAXON_ID=83371 /ORGANISM="Detonula confervacea, Strain CCMP 353" /LENGTH=41 /DNA_ID= /DNA_START= /DNA_END= /DNA_ORIENTATION=
MVASSAAPIGSPNAPLDYSYDTVICELSPSTSASCSDHNIL